MSVGQNGCGKSTILKIIAGADISYSGSIAKAPGLKISVLPQDTNGLCGTLDEFSERLGVDSELVRGYRKAWIFTQGAYRPNGKSQCRAEKEGAYSGQSCYTC
ncbi:MAG: ATP-binding cassette domain-containing protein [[Eubacterium] siraeum]